MFVGATFFYNCRLVMELQVSGRSISHHSTRDFLLIKVSVESTHIYRQIACNVSRLSSELLRPDVNFVHIFMYFLFETVQLHYFKPQLHPN